MSTTFNSTEYPKLDVVDEASLESFPASDPPARRVEKLPPPLAKDKQAAYKTPPPPAADSGKRASS